LKHLKDETGVALIVELVLVAMVLAAVGVAVYMAVNHKTAPTVASKTIPTPSKSVSPTPTPNPYAGWATCADNYEGLSIKYPTNWTVVPVVSSLCGSNKLVPDSYEDFFSPADSGNMLYQLRYWSDMAIEPTPTPGSAVAGDPQTVSTVEPIKIAGVKAQLYLDAYLDTEGSKASSTEATMYALTDQVYSVGQVFYGTPYITSQTHPGYHYMMTVRLTKAPQGTQDLEEFTTAQFEGEQSYGNLINVFKSLTYQ
jgi:hypothetical protein